MSTSIENYLSHLYLRFVYRVLPKWSMVPAWITFGYFLHRLETENIFWGFLNFDVDFTISTLEFWFKVCCVLYCAAVYSLDFKLSLYKFDITFPYKMHSSSAAGVAGRVAQEAGHRAARQHRGVRPCPCPCVAACCHRRQWSEMSGADSRQQRRHRTLLRWSLVSCAPGSNYQKSAELLGCGCVRFLIVPIVTDHLPRVVTRHTRD